MLVPTVASQRCDDLVSPFARLTQSALRELPEREGRVDKFIFVSASCLPAKPFGFVHEVLTSYGDTDVCLQSQGWQPVSLHDKVLYLVKHDQWAILSRRHANEFARGGQACGSRRGRGASACARRRTQTC